MELWHICVNKLIIFSKDSNFVRLAPEILKMKTYSELCDVWAIGIIMYMMLYGKSPFRGKNDDEISYKICNDEPSFDNAGVSEEVIQLLQSILVRITFLIVFC